ncbi:MAG: hypothetical protein ABI456_13460 [Ktedonobacteraceae bacterium]|nr:hypothetical protein [Chloroflexota bacterium]
MKKKLRRIMVDGQIYLWKFVPGYVATHDPANPWQCHDHFTAYLLQMKASPLQVSFLSWEDPVSGGPLRTGMSPGLDEIHSQSWRVYLHTPKYAAWIIQRALKAGWQPEQSRAPFVVEQGVQWLIPGRDY